LESLKWREESWILDSFNLWEYPKEEGELSEIETLTGKWSLPYRSDKVDVVVDSSREEMVKSMMDTEVPEEEIKWRNRHLE